MGSFSFRLLDRRVMVLLAAAMLIVATVVSTFAMAAQVTERSIELSSASSKATDVTYDINFTSVGAAGAFVVDFCQESPILGQACTTPTGFNLTAATTATAGFTRTVLDSNTIMFEGTIGAAAPIQVAIDDVVNPTVTGSVYARIATYVDAETANGYTSADPDVDGDHIDDGGLAFAITDAVAVSGLVQESMTFCVSAAEITANCTGVTAPTLALGETVGSTKALAPGIISTGNLYTQISTNASQGAVVRLKSNAVGCGGLIRAGAEPGECDILPALTGDIVTGESEFGVKTTAAASTNASGATDPTGSLIPSAGYNNTAYRLGYISGDATGVTSTYGDEFLNTEDAPASNQNMGLVFGATVNNNTPAGKYSADLSLIATGKF
jgi:hypothetical protein